MAIIEIWKDIKGYKNKYKISNFGRVKSLKDGWGNYRELILKDRINSDGYLHVSLGKNNVFKDFKNHRLVGEHFIPNPNNKSEINHKDGIKTHCHRNNLEWNTHGENMIHASKIGLIKNRENSPISKLTEWDVKIIRKLYKNTKYWRIKKIAELFNISYTHTYYILDNKFWVEE